MNKLQQIKRRMLMESGIALGALVLLGGVLFGLSALYDSYEMENNKLTSEVAGINAQMSNLQRKYDNVQKYVQLYGEASAKEGKDGLSLNRQVVRDRFDQYKQKYFLGNLKLSMAPVQELAEQKYKRDTVMMIASDVTVTFEANSDEDVYAMLQEIKKDLTGTVRVTQLALTRVENVTNEALKSLSERGAATLVKGELKFTWLGLRSIANNATLGAPNVNNVNAGTMQNASPTAP